MVLLEDAAAARTVDTNRRERFKPGRREKKRKKFQPSSGAETFGDELKVSLRGYERRRRVGKAGGKAWKSSSAVRGADPPQHRLGEQRCSAVPPPLINDWTEQRQNTDQFLITIDANAASLRLAFAPKSGEGAPGSGAKAHRGGKKARKVRKALTCSRRRSNFFQYWNIDPTSAAILGDIEEIFFSGCNKYVGWIPPSLNNITVAPQKKEKKTHTHARTRKKNIFDKSDMFLFNRNKEGGKVLLSSYEVKLWAGLDFKVKFPILRFNNQLTDWSF